MSDDCITLAINGFLADSVTPDGNGAAWTVERIDGWWDSGSLRVEIDEVQPAGEEITRARENGRPLVVEVVAHAPGGATALGELGCYLAVTSIEVPFRILYEPVTMTVTDPVLELHALVRRVGEIKHAIIGKSAAVRFQIPLLAPDPYRYDGSDNPFD